MKFKSNHCSSQKYILNILYISYFNKNLQNINNTLIYLTKYYTGRKNFIFIDTKNLSQQFCKYKKEPMKYQGTILNISQSVVVVCR